MKKTIWFYYNKKQPIVSVVTLQRPIKRTILFYSPEFYFPTPYFIQFPNLLYLTTFYYKKDEIHSYLWIFSGEQLPNDIHHQVFQRITMPNTSYFGKICFSDYKTIPELTENLMYSYSNELISNFWSYPFNGDMAFNGDNLSISSWRQYLSALSNNNCNIKLVKSHRLYSLDELMSDFSQITSILGGGEESIFRGREE